MIVTKNQVELATWFAIHADLPLPKDMQYIGCSIGGNLVAVNGYENFNGASMYVHVASDGRSLTTHEFIWVGFDYPFNYCGAQMLIAPIASSNAKALRFTKHLGFKVAFELEGAHPDGALVYLTMRKEDCRFLTPNWSRA